MTARPPSQTAQSAARSRAVHWLREEEPKVLNDWVAAKLLDYETPEDLLAAYDAAPSARLPGASNLSAVRNRYAEDEFQKAHASYGCDQYVIIGAGLDSFAYRRADSFPCAIYEIDHPSSQQWKRDRLAHAGIACPASLRHVAVDFEEQEASLVAALEANGFDRTRPAFFAMLGVSQYLSLASLKGLLKAVASASSARCTLVMERVRPLEEGHLEGQEAEMMERLLATTTKMAEPWITFLDEPQTDAVFKEAGFDSIHHELPSDSIRRYLQGRKNDQMPKVAALVLASTSGA